MLFFFIVLIIVIATGITLYFRLRKPGMAISVINQKYGDLIEMVKNHNQVLAARATSRSYSFKIKMNKNLHTYSFTEVDERIIVVWTFDSSSQGRRGKEWSFSTNYPQEKMFEEINSDLKAYEKRMHLD